MHYQRINRLESHEKILGRMRKWWAQNRNRSKVYWRRYYAKNRSEILRRDRLHKIRSRAHRLIYGRAYYLKNRSKRLAWASRAATDLRDSYLLSCLRWPRDVQPPRALLEAKRAQLQLHRLIKNKEKS